MHGFDEFFGNLYHLNAEEEPEYADYPKDPDFRKKFGPRGVMKCKATDKDDTTVDPTVRQGRQAGDREHRPADHEAHGNGRRGIPRRGARLHGAQDQGRRARGSATSTPTRMHVFTHLKPSSVGKTGLGLYPDGMVELDGYVGQLLEKLDELGVADNTIVVFTTDNGAEVLSWPDGGATPFRGEKDTNWEGGWRVPCVMRWPGVIEPGRVINDICSLQDFIPTFAAAAGEPDLVDEGEEGLQDRRQDLQGPPRRLQPHAVPCRARRRNRRARASSTGATTATCMALRVNQYKIVFAEQRSDGSRRLARAAVAAAHSQVLRSARRSVRARRGKLQVQRLVRRARVRCSTPRRRSSHEWLESFKEFPPRAKSASFTHRPDRRGADAEAKPSCLPACGEASSRAATRPA